MRARQFLLLFEVLRTDPSEAARGNNCRSLFGTELYEVNAEQHGFSLSCKGFYILVQKGDATKGMSTDAC